MTWLTAVGTGGVETILTIELEPSDNGTLLKLAHEGFADQAAADGHADAWPTVLEILDDYLSASD